MVRCQVLLKRTLNPILLLGGVLPNNVYVDCPLFKMFFWNYSLNFFSRNFVSAIFEICLDLNFFWFCRDICGCVVYFNKRAVCFVKNISAYFCVHSFVFYIGKFSVGGHSSWEIKFFLSFWSFFCCSNIDFMVLFAVFDMYRPDGAGGEHRQY